MILRTFKLGIMRGGRSTVDLKMSEKGDPIFSTKIALPFSPLFRVNLKRPDFSGDFGTFIKEFKSGDFSNSKISPPSSVKLKQL